MPLSAERISRFEMLRQMRRGQRYWQKYYNRLLNLPKSTAPNMATKDYSAQFQGISLLFIPFYVCTMLRVPLPMPHVFHIHLLTTLRRATRGLNTNTSNLKYHWGFYSISRFVCSKPPIPLLVSTALHFNVDDAELHINPSTEPISSPSSLDSNADNNDSSNNSNHDNDNKSTGDKFKDAMKKPFHSSSREEVKSPEMQAGLEFIEEQRRSE